MTRCFFPLFGNVSPCKEKWVGGHLCTVLKWMAWGFFKGCVLTKREWARMNLCCVRVLEGKLWLLGSRGRILQWKCNIAMNGGGGGFLLFVSASPPTQLFASLSYKKQSFCGKGVCKCTHMLMHKHTPGWWMNGRTDCHTGLLLMTSLPCIWPLRPLHDQRAIQSTTAAPWLFHRRDAYCLFFRELFTLAGSTFVQYASVKSDGTVNVSSIQTSINSKTFNSCFITLTSQLKRNS